ncbi:MAG: hypothetical protein EHM39_07385, partial [Chloroflexi bacterium]
MSALNDQRAWLLDLFADERDGLVLWFLAEDGKRLRLHQPFPVTFYAAGAPALLDEFERYLRASLDRLDLQQATINAVTPKAADDAALAGLR